MHAGRTRRLLGTLLVLAASSAAPAELPDEATLLQRLTEAKDQRGEYDAGQALGRARSVQGLERLVARRSASGIVAYGIGMAIGRFTRHDDLGPEVEALIVRHFDDPEIGGPLRNLVVGGRYHTRPLFDLFRRRLERPDLGPEDYNNLAGQICRTDLPVEKELLAILLAFPGGKETARGRTLLYNCLAERHYDPATPRIEQALRVEDRYEVDVALGALVTMGTQRSLAAWIAYARTVRASGDTARADQMVRVMLLGLERLPPDAPVDFAALRETLPPAMDATTTQAWIQLIEHRHELDGVPDLLAIIAERRGSMDGRAFSTLLALDAPDGWRQGQALLDRMKNERTIAPSEYEARSRMLAERLAAPDQAVARLRAEREDKRSNVALQEAEREPRERLARAASLAETDPAAAVVEYEKALGALEALLGGHADASASSALRRELAQDYVRLGNLVRFALRQPARAVELYEKARAYEDPGSGAMLSGFHLADLYEFDLGEKGKALAAYKALRAALQRVGKPSDTETRMFVEWWDAWLGHETRFLHSGARVSHTVPREESLGFFTGMFFLLGLDPSHPALGPLLRQTEREKLDRDAVRSTLRSLPPSRLILARTAAFVGYLEPDEMVAYLERHDPSRFWSASLLTTAVLMTADPTSQTSEFHVFPSPEELQRTGGNPFPAAAARFTALTGLRLDVAPEERFATPEKTWAVFVDALRAGDRATVIACFTPRMRYRVEPGFRSMSNEKMKDLAASELGAGTAMSDTRRDYAATVGSERLAGNVTFVKILGAWRIEGM